MAPFLMWLLLLSGLALPAQVALVLPLSHASQEGTSSSNLPFGRGTPVRLQCAYDGSQFPGPVVITALAVRLDGGAQANAKQVDFEVRMSTLPRPLVQLAAAFASNRGADEQVVLPRQIRQLPGGAAVAGPTPFQPPIGLAMPFAYNPQLGPLLIEWIVYGQPPGSYALDLTFVCDSPEVVFGPAGCLPPAGLPVVVESATTQVMWGRPWQVRVRQAPAAGLVLLALGNQESGPWQGFQLPQELSQLGAPGCHLAIDAAATFLAVAAGDGSALFAFQIPSQPAAVGLWFRYQAAALVPQANPLGLVTSQARKVPLCGMAPVGRVWASGLAAIDGALELGSAAVLQCFTQ
jgi:hypothetical protein